MLTTRTIFASALTVLGWLPACFAVEPSPINHDIPLSQNSYYASELRCPKLNSGILEFSMKTQVGDVTRIWVKYSGSLPVRVKMLLYPGGSGPAETAIDVGLGEVMDEPAQVLIRKIRKHTDAMYAGVCTGDALAKAKYEEQLSVNRTFVQGAVQ